MENYTHYLVLETENIGLNTDILETNVINILLLIILLFVVLKNFLQENLGARKNKILTDVENAEKRLADSNERYREAEKQWSQIQIIVEDIQNQAEQTKQNILKAKCTKAKEDISKKFSTATAVLRYREQKTFNDILKGVSEKALKKVINKLKAQLGKREQSAIVDSKLELLGDKN